jgi:hypothetical protein
MITDLVKISHREGRIVLLKYEFIVDDLILFPRIDRQRATYRIDARGKNYLDRKMIGLYYTKAVGNINLDMKKPVAITLAFLFSVTVLLSGAFGYSDCAAICAREMVKAHQHGSMGSASLAAANCCTGAMKNTCEMAQMIEIKIPECSVTSHQTVFPDSISVGFFASDTDTDIFQPTQPNRRFIVGEINSRLPIYLKTLSILC